MVRFIQTYLFLLIAGLSAPCMASAQFASAQPSRQDILSFKRDAEGDLPYQGAATAPMDIRVYLTASCGHCANFYEVSWPDIVKKYVSTGKARFAIEMYDNGEYRYYIYMQYCTPSKYFPKYLRYLFDNTHKIYNAKYANTTQALIDKQTKLYLDVVANLKFSEAERIDFNRCMQSSSTSGVMRGLDKSSVYYYSLKNVDMDNYGLPTLYVNRSRYNWATNTLKILR